MNRAYSVLTVKAVDEEKRVITGIATTPAPDRMGDIVEPLGVKFKNPMPLLWQHRSSEPVGSVRFDKPTEEGITFSAKIESIAEPGRLKDRLDEAWQSVKIGLVRAVSIGFRAIEHSFMDDGGIRFMQSEVMELSLVTIPANSDATIQSIKSFDAEQRAASGRKLTDDDRPTPPAPGKSSIKVVKAKEANPVKTIAEQIAAFTATRETKAARMLEIMQKSGETGETLDAAQQTEYDDLKSELEAIDKHLVRLNDMQKMNLTKAAPVEPSAGLDPAKASEARAGVVQVRRALPKGYGFVRLLGARYMAKEYNMPAWQIAESRGWGDEMVGILKMPKDQLIEKAAIAAANTTDSAWAGPLVTYNNLQEEFIELLRPLTIIERIPGLRRVPFNIKVPREITATTAYWVGQGSPKPVSAGALDTVTLDFAKIAGITFQTQELLKFSRPNSESIMVNSLTKAIAYLMDRDFLDPSKAASTGVSPASITNGATTVTASGTTADAFRTDFGNLLALFTLNNNGALGDIVVVMSQTQALRLSLMQNDFGNKEFPGLSINGGSIEGIPVVTSDNIAANGGSPADGWPIVAMRASDIMLADDGAVDVDISTEASIQADSAPDSPNTASTVMVSLWQNNLVGIRCERFITWAKARTTSVYYITGGNYR